MEDNNIMLTYDPLEDGNVTVFNKNINERLIDEVKKRPSLWDKRNDFYKNKTAMEDSWDAISNVLRRDKEFLKQKWRNLRDQFQRETKKVKIPFDSPTKPYIEYYRGKWQYFEPMLFLFNSIQAKYPIYPSPHPDVRIMDVQDVLRKLTQTCQKIGHSSNSLDDCEIQENVIPLSDNSLDLIEPKIEIKDEFEEIAHARISFEYEPEQESKIIKKEVPETVTQTTDDHETLITADEEDKDESNEQEEISTSRKRKLSENESEEHLSKRTMTEMIETGSQTEVTKKDVDDDDLHFVKSLLPYFRKMAPLHKLFVRNEINNLVIKESLGDASWKALSK